MAGIKYAKFGDYMTKTKGGKDSSASSSYGSNPGGGGGAGYSAPSAAPSDNEIKNTKSKKTKLKDSLQNIVDNKGGQGYETAPGIVAIPTMGKNTGKFKKIEDKLKAGIPLSGGEQVIADFYLSSAVNPYAAKMQQFKEQPGGMAAFKEKFPNPLAVIAGGIGDFFKKGTLLGKFLTSLNKSDQNKVDIITNDPQGVKQGPPAYDVNQYGLGGFYEDKILRDLNLKDRLAQQSGPEGLTLNTAGMNEGIMAGAEPYDAQAAYRRKVVEKYYGASGNISQAAIDKAYNQIISKMKESETNMEGPYAYQAGYPEGDYTNFQEQIVDEVVEGPEQPLDGSNIFELGSDNLAGSVSETDYQNPEFMGLPNNYIMNEYEQSQLGEGNSKMVPNTNFASLDPNINPGVPFTEYTDPFLMPPSSSMHSIPMNANGGYMNSFPNQNLNTQSLSASDNIDDRIMKNLQYEKMSPGMMGYNAGGYAGMSTFDKLKMIADSGYQS
jgi:hypothetical protein